MTKRMIIKGNLMLERKFAALSIRDVPIDIVNSLNDMKWQLRQPKGSLAIQALTIGCTMIRKPTAWSKWEKLTGKMYSEVVPQILVNYVPMALHQELEEINDNMIYGGKSNTATMALAFGLEYLKAIQTRKESGVSK